MKEKIQFHVYSLQNKRKIHIKTLRSSCTIFTESGMYLTLRSSGLGVFYLAFFQTKRGKCGNNKGESSHGVAQI